MKKIIGVLLLMVGLAIAILIEPCGCWSDLHIKIIIGSVCSLPYFIIGIRMVATKTSSQKEKEAELDAIKRWANHKNNQDDFYIQFEKLGKLKERGLITEEEFQAQKKKILCG